MPVDFAALARSVRAVPGVRACLLLSRDGFTLGVEPASEEERVMAGWARLATLGEVERGFVVVAGDLWVFCGRGPFAAVVSADPGARPGVILAHLEQMLLAADEVRVQGREEIRTSAGRPAEGVAPQRFRAPLHRERTVPEPQPAGTEEHPQPVSSGTSATQSDDRSQDPGVTRDGSPDEPRPERRDDDWEVDAVQLAREFGGLYSPRDDSAEGLS